MASQATLDRLQAEFDTPPEAIAAAVSLLDEKAPPAFLSRYRRWAIGPIGEERLQAIADRLHFLHDLEQRRQAIAQQAQERGKLTDDLQATLATSVDQDLLDDLYQSMRPKRRTVAVQMEEKGLGPLAMAIQHRQLGDGTLLDAATQYISEPNGLPTPEAVLEGVLLILSERIVGDPATRGKIRSELQHGILRARPVNPEAAAQQADAQPYQEFFDFAEPITRIGSNRMLALRRAEREGILQLQLTLPDGRHREILRALHAPDLAEDSPLREFFDLVFDHAWNQGLQEACSRDVRRRIKEKADREAVRTCARNLRSQLLSPPLGHKKVLALRTSSKTVWLALLAEDGSVAQHKTLQLDTDEAKKASMDALCALVRDEQPAAIAVPHGRRQAGSEKLVDELRTALGETRLPMLVPVDEAASAIFATSATGRKALPGVEVGVRTAISLGRRLQDPMRELIRMDYRTLGLGQQLDEVHQGMLHRELDAAVASCVALTDTDLNTADKETLAFVPGITEELAAAIVEHRRKIGGFQNRAQLREVPGIDEITFRHLAGFVTILGGSEPLDRTPVHPEDYDLARAVAAQKGVAIDTLFGADLRDVDIDALARLVPATNLPAATGTPPPGFERQRVIGVLQALRHAGKDPRGELTATVNAGVTKFDDLRADLELKGRVAGLTEFGAFVDLGIGHDGLVHISQIPGFRLRDPAQMLRVGEVVTVWVLHTDKETHKISLTMHEPRHLAEGRAPTIGERMDRGRGRREQRPADGSRRDGPRRERQEARPAFSRAARTPESRKGRQRRPPLTPDGKPEHPRIPEGEPVEAAGSGGNWSGPSERRGRHGGRDRRDDGGPRDPRVFTVESEKEVAETRGRKGEMTSLASLRALLDKSRGSPPSPTAP
jgi:uncharacterized protein